MRRGRRTSAATRPGAEFIRNRIEKPSMRSMWKTRLRPRIGLPGFASSAASPRAKRLVRSRAEGSRAEAGWKGRDRARSGPRYGTGPAREASASRREAALLFPSPARSRAAGERSRSHCIRSRESEGHWHSAPAHGAAHAEHSPATGAAGREGTRDDGGEENKSRREHRRVCSGGASRTDHGSRRNIGPSSAQEKRGKYGLSPRFTRTRKLFRDRMFCG